MKKLVKKIMALGLSVGMIAGLGFGFAGCDLGKTDVPDTPIVEPNQNQNQNPGNQDIPNTEPEKDKEPDIQPDVPTPPVQKKTLSDAKKEFNAFVKKITVGKNFTYTMKGPSNEVTAEFASDKLKLNNNKIVSYLSKENGKNFVFRLKSDNDWHKDVADKNSTIDYVLSSITDSLSDITWTSYDADFNLLSGKVPVTSNNVTSQAQIQANFDKDEMNIKLIDGMDRTNLSFARVGTTVVQLPRNFVDDAKKESYILSVKNGKDCWNYKLLKQELLAWLRNEMTDENGNHIDNQYGRPMGSTPNSKNENSIIRDVIFLNPTRENLDFGVVIYKPTGDRFVVLHLHRWKENLTSKKTEITKEDFRAYVLKLVETQMLDTVRGVDVEYSTIDEDYESEHKHDFEILTKNVFERYAKEKSPTDFDYDGAKIYFGIKGEMGATSKTPQGYYAKHWYQFYVVEKDEKLSYIEVVDVKGLIDGLGPYQNVLQNVEGRWSIYAIWKVIDVDEQNRELLGDPIMTVGESKNLNKE